MSATKKDTGQRIYPIYQNLQGISVLKKMFGYVCFLNTVKHLSNSIIKKIGLSG